MKNILLYFADLNSRVYNWAYKNRLIIRNIINKSLVGLDYVLSLFSFSIVLGFAIVYFFVFIVVEFLIFIKFLILFLKILILFILDLNYFHTY